MGTEDSFLRLLPSLQLLKGCVEMHSLHTRQVQVSLRRQGVGIFGSPMWQKAYRILALGNTVQSMYSVLHVVHIHYESIDCSLTRSRSVNDSPEYAPGTEDGSSQAAQYRAQF